MIFRLLDVKDFQVRYGADEAYWAEDVRICFLKLFLFTVHFEKKNLAGTCINFKVQNLNFIVYYINFIPQLAKVFKEKKASLLLTLVSTHSVAYSQTKGKHEIE